MTQDPASMHPSRIGEVMLPIDPADASGDAHLVFIGRVRSPWTKDVRRPKNPSEAREQGGGASLEIDVLYRAALQGLDMYSHVIVLAWLHGARRDALVIHPPHADAPRGVFALRSPVRPNPIGLTVARLVHVDHEAGIVQLDAIDFMDETPLIDLKPYRRGIDSVPDAVVG